MVAIIILATLPYDALRLIFRHCGWREPADPDETVLYLARGTIQFFLEVVPDVVVSEASVVCDFMLNHLNRHHPNFPDLTSGVTRFETSSLKMHS